MGLILHVAGKDFGAFGDPDHLTERASGRQEERVAAQSDAIAGAAIGRMKDVDRHGPLAKLDLKRDGSEFVIGEAGGNAAKGSGGDQLGVAAPRVMAGVHLTLKILHCDAIDREIVHDALLFRRDLREADVHGGGA